MFKSAVTLARKYSTVARQYNEIQFPVPWGHISGKWWEPTTSKPILAIHGWQDTCESFDRLIPLLTKDVGVLAIDLPGHGYSSKLPAGMFYDNMNYPILIRYIMKYFGWPTVSLMGHSLGAISCYTFAMMYNKDIDFLVLIDGLKPLEQPNSQKQMASVVEQFLKYDKLSRDQSEPPTYPLEVLKEMLSKTLDNSIDIEYAELLLRRNIQPSVKDPNKYYVTRDPRLKSIFFGNWGHNELVEYAAHVTCPLLFFKASSSGYFEKKENPLEVFETILKVSPNCHYKEVEGKHHVHLNNPERLNGMINEFIKKYNKVDRSVGKFIESAEVQ
ncbi:probable serine hydrolase isoform X3 [Aethina tumida]|uniref:probable serine hydrolase isoform X3 n=1 Tax=Aethina tumida TaxID=116153 RepID=UPI00214932F3|nr:probable serine hydrolase isoform X3 [Aethina tumida]